MAEPACTTQKARGDKNQRGRHAIVARGSDLGCITAKNSLCKSVELRGKNGVGFHKTIVLDMRWVRLVDGLGDVCCCPAVIEFDFPIIG